MFLVFLCPNIIRFSPAAKQVFFPWEENTSVTRTYPNISVTNVFDYKINWTIILFMFAYIYFLLGGGAACTSFSRIYPQRDNSENKDKILVQNHMILI